MLQPQLDVSAAALDLSSERLVADVLSSAAKGPSNHSTTSFAARGEALAEFGGKYASLELHHSILLQRKKLTSLRILAKHVLAWKRLHQTSFVWSGSATGTCVMELLLHGLPFTCTQLCSKLCKANI